LPIIALIQDALLMLLPLLPLLISYYCHYVTLPLRHFGYMPHATSYATRHDKMLLSPHADAGDRHGMLRRDGHYMPLNMPHAG
jgi:hypothetical protein